MITRVCIDNFIGYFIYEMPKKSRVLKIAFYKHRLYMWYTYDVECKESKFRDLLLAYDDEPVTDYTYVDTAIDHIAEHEILHCIHLLQRKATT